MADNTKVLSYDMVYMPIGTTEFRNIRIEVFIEKDNFKVVIVSERDIAKVDLSDLVDKLRRDLSAKIKVNLDDDCLLYLNVNEKLDPIGLPLQ